METPGESVAVRDVSSLGERVWWLIKLRWLAIVGLFAVVTAAAQILDIELKLRELYLIGGLLALLNVMFFLICRTLRIRQDRGGRRVRVFANAQIAADLIVLAGLIHYSGGVENPFAFYFIFHVIVSGTLLSPREAWLQAGLAVLLFGGTINLERVGAMPHHHVPGLGPPDLYLNPIFVAALSAAFASTMCLAVFTAITITRLMREQQKESTTLIGQLQQAYSKLGELERSKSRYLRRVSHELRAPLGAIENLLSMVEDALTGEGRSGERGLVARAGKRADQALKLVSDLLILARTQEARSTVVMKEVSLAHAVSEAVGALRPRADRQGVAVRADVPPDLPPILGDAESIEQLISNLTANAIKYTPRGGQVNVSAAARDDHVLIRVADTGIGIPADDLPYVFDEFYRGTNARQFAEQGTGLGLSIVKSVADMHGAEIRVQSNAGHGTTFEVAMPRADASPPRAGPGADMSFRA